MSIERFVRRNTKIILGGIVVVLALSLSTMGLISTGDPTGESGDALVMFDNVIVSNRDNNRHLLKARAAYRADHPYYFIFKARGFRTPEPRHHRV